MMMMAPSLRMTRILPVVSLFLIIIVASTGVHEVCGFAFTGYTHVSAVERFSATSTARFSTTPVVPAAVPPEPAAATADSLHKWLDGMTVKELKQVLQVNGLNQRGLSSKLKRKQDLLDYLKENLASSSSPITDAAPITSISEACSTPSTEPAVVELEAAEPTSHTTSDDDDVLDNFPNALRDKLQRRGITQLLPIQSASYQHIFKGNDAVLKSPTGSGKTFAFCWPLCARILQRKDPLYCRPKGKHSSARNVAVSPRILVLVPNRELACQVGKEFQKFTNAPAATVFGGVPIERHESLVRKGGAHGAHVVVATPGRWRELVRENVCDYDEIRAVVLDEADVLLDAADSPDVTQVLDKINQVVGDRPNYDDQVYQLLLASATINDVVLDFAEDTMEISPSSTSFFSVDSSSVARELLAPSTDVNKEASSPSPLALTTRTRSPAVVSHFYTPVKTIAQPSVTANLITSLAPQLCIVFVATKADTESVADWLQQRLQTNNARVRTLHGDMSQAQRSRTIALIREASAQTSTTSGMTSQILVATDVASRGLDLPNVDLVVQFGIPRVAGKEGTYNVELFTHRTGRAGRVGMNNLSRSANTVMLYDPAVGEGRLLDDLVQDVQQTLGVQMEYRPIPSSTELVESAYQRAASRSLENASEMNPELLSYFRNRLQSEDASILDISSTEDLLDKLAKAMALLADLDPNMSPHEPACSLLTGDSNDRTVKVYQVKDDGSDRDVDSDSITPPQVTKFCKQHNSGKLGRMRITTDGSEALFDLPTGRAKRLLETVAAAAATDTQGWRVQMATKIPDPR